jgi:cytoskeletal protein RodZ
LGIKVEKLTKILIVVVIVLVAGLSLCMGLLLGNYLNQPNIDNNTTTNQTASINQTDTTSTTTQQQSTNESNDQESTGISEGQAVQIALAAVGPINEDYYTIDTFSTGIPYKWHIDFYSKKTKQHIIGVSINAVTGEVRAIYKL